MTAFMSGLSVRARTLGERIVALVDNPTIPGARPPHIIRDG
ncbi:hypothetical protein [Gordonia sp. NPDC003376]